MLKGVRFQYAAKRLLASVIIAPRNYPRRATRGVKTRVTHAPLAPASQRGPLKKPTKNWQ